LQGVFKSLIFAYKSVGNLPAVIDQTLVEKPSVLVKNDVVEAVEALITVPTVVSALAQLMA